MKKLNNSKPNAHPTRRIFKINDIPLTEVSRILRRNYSYVCSMLAGSRPVPRHIDRRLHELASIVVEKFGRQDPKERAFTPDSPGDGVQLG